MGITHLFSLIKQSTKLTLTSNFKSMEGKNHLPHWTYFFAGPLDSKVEARTFCRFQ